MMRRLILIIAVAACAAAAAASAAGAGSDAPRVTEANGSSFPGRAYVLSLPRGMQLAPGSVHVYENGQPVNDLTVTPVEQSKPQQFAALLAIDSSTSMEGRPETAAFAAARAFASQRQPHQQLGVLTYNRATTVILPFTTDSGKIAAALSQQPRFVYGTYIYDAVVQGINLLKASHISAGTIVLLSDGQEAPAPNNKVAHQTEATAAAAARTAHVRVFTVGLRSRLAKLGTLRLLARDTGGRYLEARSVGELTQIYNELGSQLASEYLLHYRSLAGPGKAINVTVKVDGLSGLATTGYETPKLAIAKPLPRAPYHISVANRIWTSVITTAIVGLIVAALVGAGAVALVSSPGKGTVRQRLAEFVSVPSAIKDSSRRPTAQVTAKMLEGTHSLLRDATWWQKFRWELEIAAISMPAEQIVALSLLGSLMALVILKFLTGSWLFAIGVSLMIPFGARAYVKRELNRRRLRFAEQLADNLQVLASALRAGHSFIGALSVVVNDAAEPARSEFQRVIADEQLGVSVEQALRTVVERMDNRELEQVALVAALQSETGGNTAEVLDRVTNTIRERFELRRTVRTLTTQGRMSRWVLTFLPISLFLLVNLINPGYMHVLYTSSTGKVFLILAVIFITAGSLIIRRIVNIKV
jgi:tight adherence protein B